MSELMQAVEAAPGTPAANKVTTYPDSADPRRIKAKWEDGSIHLLSQAENFDNALLNGGFWLAQRQAPGTLSTYSNTSGRAYGADRWGMTNENASIQYQRIDSSGTPETGLQARYYGKFKKITSAGKMVVSQVIEGTDVMSYRGRVVRFQAKMKYSVAGSMTVRMAVLQLTAAGALDTIPATFVSAFGAVGTDPTFGTNLAALTPIAGIADGGSIVGNGLTCVLASTWTRYSFCVTVPSDCKNLVLVTFTNGQPAANDELNVSEAGLYDGYEIMDWSPRPIQQIIALCQRFYAKTFELDSLPQATTLPGALRSIVGKAAAALGAQFHWRFPVVMRGTPTVATFNPVTAANTNPRRTGGTAGDETAVATANISSVSADITATDAAAGAVGDAVQVQATADAEL